jgi:preprotein translocase subunit SecA
MFNAILRKIFGSKNDREMKRLSLILHEINQLEPAMTAATDDELRAKTPYFKEKLENGAELDDILVEVFAVVREVSRRTVGMRPLMFRSSAGLSSTRERSRK